MEYDTIIIGAGMSGLAAGVRLAHYSRRVLVLERHRAIGGMNSFYRRGNRLVDVGLHAVTNYAPRGIRGPLSKLLRQLRMSWDDFSLAPQCGSSVRFPGCVLRFSNDVEMLKSEIAAAFPNQVDGFERLIGRIVDYDLFGSPECSVSARGVVSELITDPLLAEMIFCPLLYYGGPSGRDLDFGQFSVLFRSIFLEGFGRPRSGIRQILRRLVDRFCGMGGELRLKTGVRRLIVRGERIEAVVLDDGTELRARRILSSAGWPETLRMCETTSAGDRTERNVPVPAVGQMAFVETISVLDRSPAELGINETATFFSRTDRLHYEPAEGPIDPRSGVICCPDNYRYDEPLDEHSVRITALAGYDAWNRLGSAEYRLEKRWCLERLIDAVTGATTAVGGTAGGEGGEHVAAGAIIPDFRAHVTETEVFTPMTIRRFTGRLHGAIYGAPEKRYDGTTHLANLFLCGTDQGLVGIIGSLISGITIANRHCLT